VTPELVFALKHRGSLTGGGNDGIFSLWHSFQTGSEAHPACRIRTGGSFPVVKRPGREADH